MDRLFQYNRFGLMEEGAEEKRHGINEKDTKNHQNKSKLKKLNLKATSHRSNKYKALTCPAYAELYPELNHEPLEAVTPPPTSPRIGRSQAEAPTTASAIIPSSATAKSVELAIRKYHEWSTKFLPSTAAPKATSYGNKQPTSSTTSPSTSSSSSSTAATFTSSGCSSASSSSSSSCGYYSQHQSADAEPFFTSTTQRKHKVYDCMKDFLKRKLFQQPAAEQKTKHTEDDDVTSDYDEVDMLDSSYNADEEYESDSSTASCSSSCPLTDDSTDEPEIQQPSSLQTTAASMLNCWTKTGQSAVTSASSSSEEDDSDAGISDCCQLLSERSPRRRSSLGQSKQKLKHPEKQNKNSFMSKQRYNMTEEDAEELLETTWYQPHLSNKAAAARLLYEAPGAFLVRRRTRNFELLLRLQQAKVGNFVVLCCGESYKFKGAKKQFSSLKALVTHHSVMAEHLPMTLTLPRPDISSQQQQLKLSLRCADDFDTFESLQILGILKRLQADDWEFS